MNLLRITNYKLASILAILYGAVSVLPLEEYGTDFLTGLVWIIAGIFVWRKTKWANLIIVILAVIDFFDDIIREIPKFNETITEMTTTIGGDLSENVISFFIILAMSLQTLFLFYFIYHGIYTLLTRDD